MKNIAHVLIVVTLILHGCGGESAPSAQSDLKLYVFDCGLIRLPDLAHFSIADDETDVLELIVPCYVIEHEKGRLLWDGGLPSSYADVDGWQGDGMLMRLDRTLSEQLVQLELDMSSFDYVAFSHSHFDHVGVANEIIGGTFIIQQTEYDAAFADEVTLPGFDPTLYTNLKTAEKIEIDGDHDVFGDGRVRIISTPGHTPGHQSLIVNLANTGPIILSGDLYHFAISRTDRRVPGFNFDKEQTLSSMDRIDALIEETGATLWIEHELALFETLNKAPAYYD